MGANTPGYSQHTPHRKAAEILSCFPRKKLVQACINCMLYKNKNHTAFELFTLCVYLFGGIGFFTNARYGQYIEAFFKNVK
jgi:hypothetical protein